MGILFSGQGELRASRQRPQPIKVDMRRGRDDGQAEPLAISHHDHLGESPARDAARGSALLCGVNLGMCDHFEPGLPALEHFSQFVIHDWPTSDRPRHRAADGGGNLVCRRRRRWRIRCSCANQGVAKIPPEITATTSHAQSTMSISCVPSRPPLTRARNGVASDCTPEPSSPDWLKDLLPRTAPRQGGEVAATRAAW